VIRTRHHAVHIGQGKRALRLVERRLLGISFEQSGDVALSCGNNDQLRLPGIALKVVDPSVMNCQPAATAFEFSHPGRDFHALIDAATRLVELAVPIDSLGAGAIRGWHTEIDRID
jgi:hypothetical protein